MRGRTPVSLALAVALAFASATAYAADVFVQGCAVTGPGRIGLEEISADVGDTVSVALSVHTDSGISVFGARINFPIHLVAYESTSAGDLTAGFEVLDGQAVGPNLRLGGWSMSTYVPAGASGSLAIVSFVVTAAGAGEFALADFADDVEDYETDCPGIVPVVAAAWGRVKARYR